ncbi:MAG: hydroxymethylglutaryl-CoA lyase [Gammaproteobacteria bacterium]|nr:hydroxymethylglutaryl-CoA lyase [Gammaproteobacteria bacterium]
MSDLPTHIKICEEGPREGFQIEPGPIATADKLALIHALGDTGVPQLQICSLVSPRLVPGWADADDVIEQFEPKPGVHYTALWFNQKGLQRVLPYRDKLDLGGYIHLSASEAFSKANLNRDRETNLAAMREQTQNHLDADVPVQKLIVMAAFGCNYHGDVTAAEVLTTVADGLNVAADTGTTITRVALCDTMGWANPVAVRRTVAAVRERWPELVLHLHLHDTRGLGIANAQAGLELGVTEFDTTVGGLGGCPFAAHPGAPGNIATEELVLLAEEQGINTGIDLERLLDAGQLAERIVGHPLPSAMLRGGSLSRLRAGQVA